MKMNPSVFFVSDDSCRIGSVSGGEARLEQVRIDLQGRPDGVAEAVKTALGPAAGRGPVVLGIPSAWCLCAPLEPIRTGRNRRERMMYEFEEKLPVAIECVSGDFVLTRTGDRCLGVCVENERVTPILEELGGAGVSIAAVCPAALLALQQVLADRSTPGAEVVLWAEDGRINLFVIEDRLPAAWYLISATREDLSARLERLAAQRGGGRFDSSTPPVDLKACDPVRVLAYDLPMVLTKQLEGMREICLLRESRVCGVHGPVLFEAAIQTAAKVQNGRVKPMVNLMPGRLAGSKGYRDWQPATKFVLAGMAALLISLSISFFYLAHRYERFASVQYEEQGRIYQKVFQKPSAGSDQASGAGAASGELIAQKLESHYKALSQGAGAAAEREYEDALAILAEVFAGLPRDVRFDLSLIRASKGELRLEGTTGTHEEAGRVAAAIRSLGLFDVDPPRSTMISHDRLRQQVQGRAQGDSRGVRFEITGRIRSSPSKSNPTLAAYTSTRNHTP